MILYQMILYDMICIIWYKLVDIIVPKILYLMILYDMIASNDMNFKLEDLHIMVGV